MPEKLPAKNAHSVEIISNAELSVYANRINRMEAEICALAGKTLHLVALIGHDLNRIKAALPLGAFMPWLKANCSVSQQQANRYQRLARYYPEYVDPEKCPANLSLNAALELISAHDDVKDLVFDAIAAGEVVEHRVVRDLCGKPPYKADVIPLQPVDKAQRAESWQLTAHACRHCFGRVLTRRLSPKKSESICAVCESRVAGDASGLCWCGVHAGHHGTIFECIRNPSPNPANPGMIMVREKKIEIKPPEIRPDRSIYIENSYECA